MARILQKKSALKKDYKNHRNKKWILGGISILWLVLWVAVFLMFKTIDKRWMILAIVGEGLIYVIYRFEKRRADVLHAGYEGERDTLKVLRNLPDDYYVLTNVELDPKWGGKTELDQLIICKQGVVIVETKNYRGTIRGDLKEEHLEKEKQVSGGKMITERVKNPVWQVNRQKKILLQYLKENGVKVPVRGIVYFVNEDVKLKVKNYDASIPILTASGNGKEVLKEIIEDKNWETISKGEVKKLVSLFYAE